MDFDVKEGFKSQSTSAQFGPESDTKQVSDVYAQNRKHLGLDGSLRSPVFLPWMDTSRNALGAHMRDSVKDITWFFDQDARNEEGTATCGPVSGPLFYLSESESTQDSPPMGRLKELLYFDVSPRLFGVSAVRDLISKPGSGPYDKYFTFRLTQDSAKTFQSTGVHIVRKGKEPPYVYQIYKEKDTTHPWDKKVNYGLEIGEDAEPETEIKDPENFLITMSGYRGNLYTLTPREPIPNFPLREFRVAKDFAISHQSLISRKGRPKFWDSFDFLTEFLRKPMNALSLWRARNGWHAFPASDGFNLVNMPGRDFLLPLGWMQHPVLGVLTAESPAESSEISINEPNTNRMDVTAENAAELLIPGLPVLNTQKR